MKRVNALLAVVALVTGAIFSAGLSPHATAQDTTGAQAQTVAFDVAENATRFFFDPSFAGEGGFGDLDSSPAIADREHRDFC